MKGLLAIYLSLVYEALLAFSFGSSHFVSFRLMSNCSYSLEGKAAIVFLSLLLTFSMAIDEDD